MTLLQRARRSASNGSGRWAVIPKRSLVGACASTTPSQSQAHSEQSKETSSCKGLTYSASLASVAGHRSYHLRIRSKLDPKPGPGEKSTTRRTLGDCK